MDAIRYTPTQVFTLLLAITLLGVVGSAAGVAIERWLGPVALWSAAILAFLALFLAVRGDLIQARAEGNLADLVFGVSVAAGACTIVPAFGVWRSRRSAPTLSLWRQMWAGLRAVYIYSALVFTMGFIFLLSLHFLH